MVDIMRKPLDEPCTKILTWYDKVYTKDEVDGHVHKRRREEGPSKWLEAYEEAEGPVVLYTTLKEVCTGITLERTEHIILLENIDPDDIRNVIARTATSQDGVTGTNVNVTTFIQQSPWGLENLEAQ